MFISPCAGVVVNTQSCSCAGLVTHNGMPAQGFCHAGTAPHQSHAAPLTAGQS